MKRTILKSTFQKSVINSNLLNYITGGDDAPTDKKKIKIPSNGDLDDDDDDSTDGE